MQTTIARYAAVLLTAVICAEPVWAGSDLEAYKSKFEKELPKIIDDHGMELLNFPEKYLKQLKDLEAVMKNSGDLDAVLAVREEFKRFEATRQVPDEALVKAPGKLQALQRSYQAALVQADLGKARRIDLLAQQYRGALARLQQKLTKEGEIEAALEVKTAQKEVSTNAYVTAAMFVLAEADAKERGNRSELPPTESLATAPPALGTPVKKTPKNTPPQLSKGLILYYSFDKVESGGKVIDDSGKGKDGVVHGAKYASKGWLGGALILDGTDDYVEIPDLDLESDSVTFMIWINGWKMDNWTGILLSRGKATGGLLFGEDERLHYMWSGDSFFNWPGGPTIPKDKWAMLALVIELDKGTLYAYSDGKLEKGVNKVPHQRPIVANLKIGWDDQLGRGQGNRRFKGLVDEVRIYDRALSEDEILAVAKLK